jgi:hypothetical protein
MFLQGTEQTENRFGEALDLVAGCAVRQAYQPVPVKRAICIQNHLPLPDSGCPARALGGRLAPSLSRTVSPARAGLRSARPVPLALPNDPRFLLAFPGTRH